MKVYYISKTNEEKFIGKVSSSQDGMGLITEFIQEKKWDAPYWRLWIEDRSLHIDVGSWSEFFRIDLEQGEIFDTFTK